MKQSIKTAISDELSTDCSREVRVNIQRQVSLGKEVFKAFLCFAGGQSSWTGNGGYWRLQLQITEEI